MKANLPKASVAVITRTKDRPELLRRAMESVIGQTYEDWIHIVVNDGGDSAPLEALARAYEHKYKGRLHYVHHDTPRGMQNASNAGIDASQSEFITIHDDDDSWMPEFLEKTVSAVFQGEPDRLIDGAVTQTTQIFEEITFGGGLRELRRNDYYHFDFANLHEMRRRNLFPPIAFLYRRKTHDLLGKFKQEYDVLGDHDFNLRFLRHYNITVLREPLANYHWRMHAEGNTVTRGVETHRAMLNRLKNDYLRESLSFHSSAIGDLDAIPFPATLQATVPPFKKRSQETPPPNPLPDPFSEKDFKCLSLDVFDTALLRMCHLPTDVFKFVESRIPIALKSDTSLPFALARALAEENARNHHQREVTLDEIYIECASILDIAPETANSLKALELSVEEELLYPNPDILALAKQAFAQGKKVVYVSDMYLSADHIENWLNHAGYPKGEVFVSSELRESKHSGKIYPLVQKRLPFKAHEIVQIGDNLMSDFVQARAQGINAQHLSPSMLPKAWCDEVEPFVEHKDDLWSSPLVGVVRRHHHEHGFQDKSLLYRLGFELAGPMYLSYLRWICHSAKKNGVKRLLLLGRDGYYLDKTLKQYGSDFTEGIDFTYIEASRKTLYFASFDCLDEAALQFLSTPHPELSAADFLSRLGLQWRDYLDTLTVCGFEDPEEQITSDSGGYFLLEKSRTQIEQLFCLIKDDLIKLFHSEKKAYTRLFDDLAFDIKTDAIVDLGWAGSSAKALSKFFKATTRNPLHAYFFGTWQYTGPEDETICMHSYFMDEGLPSDNAAILSESINWIEALFSAPFPTLLELKINDGQIIPIYSTNSETGFSVAEQGEIWEGAESFLRAAASFATCPAKRKDGWAYLSLVLKRLLQEPSPEELNTWGNLKHSDGFGSEVHRPLVTPCGLDASPQELLNAYDTSTWKRAFLSKITKDQADFVIERRFPQPEKNEAGLLQENQWLRKQQDEMWAEKNAREHENLKLQKEIQAQAKLWEEGQSEIKRLNTILEEINGELRAEKNAREHENLTLQKEIQAQAKLWEEGQSEIKRLNTILEEINVAEVENQYRTLSEQYSLACEELHHLRSLGPLKAMIAAWKRNNKRNY